jgi:hypothetical protein
MLRQGRLAVPMLLIPSLAPFIHSSPPPGTTHPPILCNL